MCVALNIIDFIMSVLSLCVSCFAAFLLFVLLFGSAECLSKWLGECARMRAVCVCVCAGVCVGMCPVGV